MPAKIDGFWDFKSYDERTWFRDLVYCISFLGLLYVILHICLSDQTYNYEYKKLNQDQIQFINRICTVSDSEVKASKGVLPTPFVDRVMCYLNHVFDGPIDSQQFKDVKYFISHSQPQDAAEYLNKMPFKVRSWFWLTGPAVYWEVVFCALFGVLCNILFVLGAVGSNSTTDPAKPSTQFDSSDILGQVAKIIYAPICTLFVVLGYSLITGQNVVDINLGKGLLIFGFIGGYYSGRVITLMDRLKDVLLPNSGPADLSQNNTAAMVQQVKIAVSLDPSVPETLVTAAAAVLNSASVQIALTGTSTVIKGARVKTDPDGTFTFTGVMAGDYTISASLPVTPAGATEPVILAGTQDAAIKSDTTQISLTIKQSED